MQSIVQEAMKFSEKEKEFRKNAASDEDLEEFGQPRIMIVGCGGAGNNTVNRLYNIGIEGAETVCINTDKQHLDNVRADKKILVGKTLTRGLGAGGYPETGKKAAELARGTLEEVLKDVDLVFVTAGLGGGTGTGVAPVVAEVAKEQGAIVVGMVSSPFRVERARIFKAEEGLEDLRRAADTVIVLDNNRLLNYVPNLPIDQAFSVMDQLIAETVKGITETITVPSLINLDYADIRTIMSCGGVAVMLVGESKSQDKSTEVVRTALNHPLLDVDYKGATGSLVHVTGGPDLSLKEAEEIASMLTYELSTSANVIWGARIRDDYEGKVRVMAIMTGVQSAQILGPQVGAGILESRSDSESFQAKKFGKMTPSSRRGEMSEPIRKRQDNSIIDFIN
ncbi:cell division protein FtsZ [Methanosarcina sp. KYL-1]|uniref:cell division protein FtsZ n=1 Tax=Methanosarcina sp. KYL-1 TaxID=2602068 RepID=UPI002100E7E7|nr:cell division protein FtsZ [Methanosarcina sp. KYL-1]MCQ1537157.1 cell division protein FtsZ [Methanosarcina sp. KYL-1]